MGQPPAPQPRRLRASRLSTVTTSQPAAGHSLPCSRPQASATARHETRQRAASATFLSPSNSRHGQSRRWLTAASSTAFICVTLGILYSCRHPAMAVERSQQARFSPVAAAVGAVAVDQTPATGQTTLEGKIRLVALFSDAGSSPFRVPWAEVFAHMRQRLAWTDPRFELLLYSEASLQDPQARR